MAGEVVGPRILDVGCGLGGTAIYLATELNAHVTAITNVQPHVRVVSELANDAGVGDMVKVVMEPDTAKRNVTVPPYLKKALAAASKDKTFAALSYSHRRELVDWIAQAKKLETRESRIEKCIAMLAKRKLA